MLLTDPQLKSNDCGISAIKTIYNIYGKNISRKYIEQHISLEEKGSRISDLKNFLNTNGFSAKFKLFDVNYIDGNETQLQELFPFILPIENKNGLHYVVVNELKNKRLKIYDPSKGSQYYLSVQEIKRKSYFNKNHWDFTDTEEKIITICTHDLAEYHINYKNALQENGHA